MSSLLPSSAAAPVNAAVPQQQPADTQLSQEQKEQHNNNTNNNNHATTSSSSPPSSSPSLALSDIVRDYTDLGRIQKLFAAASDNYRDAQALLHKKKDSLEKFKIASQKNSLPLPNSLHLRIVERVKLPSVPAGLCAEELTLLHNLERETSQQIYDIMIKAKMKEIDYLTRQVQIPSHIQRHSIAFEKTVREDAAAMQENLGAAPTSSASFPVDETVKHFNTVITADLNKLSMQLFESRRVAEEARKKDLADKHAAQAAVLSAPTATTIAALADHRVNNALQPLKRAIAQMKEKESSHASKVSRGQDSKDATSRRHGGRVPLDPSTGSHRVGREAKQTVEFQFDPALFSSSSSLKGQGGDRTQQKHSSNKRK